MAYIRKLKSGKYQVNIRRTGLNPITKTFPTKRLATTFQREVEGNQLLLESLGKPLPEVITFQQYVDIYLQTYTGKDPSTIGRLNHWCKVFGDKPMLKITDDIVDNALIELSIRVTGSTVNRYKSTLSAVFIHFNQSPEYKKHKFANPVRSEFVSTYSENPAKERYLTVKEQDKLLEACKQSHWNKLYLLILLALTTGARKGELLNIKWSDINFHKKLITLEGTQTSEAKGTKNGKSRLLPLTETALAELTRFRQLGNTLVFNSTVSHLTPYEIRKPFAKALKQACISNFRFHDLRHTCASNLASNGATLFEIGEVLGHSSPEMTKRYSHLCVERKADLINRVMSGLG